MRSCRVLLAHRFTAFCPAPAGSGFCPPFLPDGKSRFAPHHVRVLPANKGAVKFVSSSFWGPAAGVALADGVGTVSFTECHFDSWDHWFSPDGKHLVPKLKAAITQLGGTLILSGNEFTQAGLSPQVSIADAGSKGKTIIAQNIIKGKLKVVNNAAKGAKVIIVNNADDSHDDEL
eukprot:COSAG01_NODE_7624_length_3123_cov_2.814815_1_plen_175_part_00